MPTLPQPSDDTAAAAAELTRRKVEAEIAKLNAETEVLWAQRRASLHRTVTLIVALVPVVATVMTTLFSIRSSYDARRLLENLDLWIVDCLRFDPHPTHAHLDKALDWIAYVKPKRAVLTHMNQSLDYDEVANRCPSGVEPAFDGMVIETG